MHKNDNQFVNFKIHTQYSICEGAIKIDEIAEYCKKNKIKSLGICDSFNLCGALEFSEKLSKAGTQPLIGTQINFDLKSSIGKLPIFAKNAQGYKNLTKLSSKSYLEIDNMSNPQILVEQLIANNEGLILLSGNQFGFFGNLYKLNKLKDIEETIVKLKESFDERFYLEVQRHKELGETNFENFLISLSSKYKIPLIASQEVFYMNQDMAEAHDALVCIGQKSFVEDTQRIKFNNDHYIKKREDLEKLFSDIPEALENNFNFPYRFSFKPKKSSPILPSIKTNEETTVEKELLNQSKIGLKKRLNDFVLKKKENIDRKKIEKIYEDRLLHELNIINSMDYPGYFLIVSDYIRWSKKNNIPVGPGRGSGAGSLVAYCLDITDIDPIEFDLIFERFLNPDRISMPDFDIDFCEEKRNLVFEYLKSKYKNGVAHIITFGKLKARMAIRDVGRVLGLPYGHVDKISKMIPFDPSRPLTLQESIDREPRFKEEIKNNKRVEKLVELSLKL